MMESGKRAFRTPTNDWLINYAYESDAFIVMYLNRFAKYFKDDHFLQYLCEKWYLQIFFSPYKIRFWSSPKLVKEMFAFIFFFSFVVVNNILLFMFAPLNAWNHMLAPPTSTETLKGLMFAPPRTSSWILILLYLR
jgi:hypothetical protein